MRSRGLAWGCRGRQVLFGWRRIWKSFLEEVIFEMHLEDGKMFFEDQISTCKGPEVGLGRYVSKVVSSALWLWTPRPASPRRHDVVQ